MASVGSRVASLASSKGYAWFWLFFTATFAVLDILTGSVLLGGLMIVLFIYWAWYVRSIYKGTNSAYNRYHGQKV